MIQSTAALMTKLALVKLREYILDKNLEEIVKIIHVVHDAIYTECKEEYSKDFSDIQSKIMIEAGKEFNLELPMETDITIENFWSK